MSIKSQEANMRRLAELLGKNLSYLHGDRVCGPNGEKKVFLNVGKAFLKALGKDLGLRDVRVLANPGGIAVSGDCVLSGMWEENGIYVCVSQFSGSQDLAVCYRTVRHGRDFKGGYNQYISRGALGQMSYEDLLAQLKSLRKGVCSYERAA